jgi:hypothetical protein
MIHGSYTKCSGDFSQEHESEPQSPMCQKLQENNLLQRHKPHSKYCMKLFSHILIKLIEKPEKNEKNWAIYEDVS